MYPLRYRYRYIRFYLSILLCQLYTHIGHTAPSSRHTRRPRRRWTKCRADCMAQQPRSTVPSGVPQNGCFFMENPKIKWMIFGGTPMTMETHESYTAVEQRFVH